MSDESEEKSGSEKRQNAPPTSRIKRLWKLGNLAPKAIPVAMRGATKVLRRGVGAERTAEAEAEAQKKMLADAKKVAEAMLKTLGEMKGLPLKLGQMASYIDGLAPPGYEERFQKALKKLQQNAPPLDPAASVKVIEEDFGVSPQELYREWEPEPFAAASVGQVHRAVTQRGENVAVKIQYPGIDKAIENDLKSLSLLEQFAAPLSRQFGSKENLEEIRSVFLSELDYGREAEMTDLFRALMRDLPDVVIPKVHHSLSKRRVLTSEFLEGQTYQEYCATASQEERNRAGITIWSFMFRSLLRHGVLYADPHPGNYRFMPDGRVGFIDFGCIKMMPPEHVSGIKRYISAAMDSDWAEFDRACIEVLGYNKEDKASWNLYRSYTIELLLPLTSNVETECSPEGARETVAYLVRGAKQLASSKGEEGPEFIKPPKMPHDFTFVNRLQWGLASVMGGLRTVANFRQLAEPWVRGPQEPLPFELSQ